MLNIDQETASRIMDALGRIIDGKPASAKTFSPVPFDDLAIYENWGQDQNNATKDTARTRALFMAYLVFSGGRIPMTGIPMIETYFRPDAWVIGALEKQGYLIVDEAVGEFQVSAKGWEFVAQTLEKLKR